jgi:23S rRNA (uracil1939-C5)-methyltransferase
MTAVRVVVERLAPTGEGVARCNGKTVFVDAALPGEEALIEIYAEKPCFARARVRELRSVSPDRRATDPHASRCGGTDWAHYEPAAARQAKRELFRETLARIGRVPPQELGELPIGASPLEYRLRNRFHVESAAGKVRWGFFEKRSRRVVALDDCEIVSAPTREKIAAAARAAARRLPEGGALTLETLETVETDSRHRLAFSAGERLEIRLPRAAFVVSAGSFFQVNRSRAPALYDHVRRAAEASGGGRALDAFAGVGFFSHALLSADFRVTAVESASSACRDAAENRDRWSAGDCLSLREARLEDYAASAGDPFDLVVADPPREGLRGCAATLARLCRRTFVYVSCEPATLARDLSFLLSQSGGFRIEEACLEDFFPLTHRVEACVILRRMGAA